MQTLPTYDIFFMFGWTGEILIYMLEKNSVTYSCFEKGCPTKPYATMPKGIMDNGDLRYLIEAFGVLVT